MKFIYFGIIISLFGYNKNKMRRFIIYLCVFIVSGFSVFFVTSKEILSFIIGICSSSFLYLLVNIGSINNRIWLACLCNTVYRKLYIRFSISYLYRIKIDGKYLLVRGNRLKDQYQPVGGVYKRYPSSNYIFRKYGILDDEYMPIDDISKDDLRVLVPARHVIKFIKWYESGKEREVTPEREFREELVQTKILSKKNFSSIEYEYVKKVETKIKFSEHFQCREILIADIYEIIVNNNQIEELRQLQKNDSIQYKWIDAETIRRRGYNKTKVIRISNTAEWVI